MTKSVERQQGNKNAGQTTLDREQRKLTKSEAGFQEDGGIPQLRCGDCFFFEGDFCRIVEGSIDADDVCNQFEPARDQGNMTADIADAVARHELPQLDMFIHRVSENRQTGERRWYATASGIKEDAYGERMTLELYKDFIRRAEAQEPAPEPFTSKAWNGGLPYLSVAHYLDLNGFGIVGTTDRIWVDGEIFKAKGTFRDTPLAERVYKAIKKDHENDVPEDERVRVSIAFVDWQHEHDGQGVFKRKSLSHSCAMCQAGVGGKAYRRGHLVHLAITRRPAYKETEIALEERSTMPSKRDDAASIVGDDLADELEEKHKETLQLRSDDTEVDPGAIVVKQEEEGDDEGAATGTADAMSDKEPVERSARLNGAVTLDDAEEALSERTGDQKYLDRWGVLEIVLRNIVDDKEKGEQVSAVLGDFQSQIDVMTAKAVMSINEILEEDASQQESPEPAQPAEPVERSEKEVAVTHPLDEALMGLREAYDEATETPLDRKSRLAMIQPAMNAVGEAIAKSIETPATGESIATAGGGVNADMLRDIVQDAVAPLAKRLNDLEATSQVNRQAPEQSPRVPDRRNLRSRPAGNPPSSLVARDNGQDQSETPKLRSLVRKSVGLEQ